MKKIRAILLVSFFIFLTARCLTAAELDVPFHFSTIETDHFQVHYHQGLSEAARKTAVLAEEAHAILTKELDWTPKEKTQIVLVDDSDLTNSFSTVIPYNAIFIQIVPPSLDMTIGEYDDWLKLIIYHEYTHILTIDPSRGYSNLTRSIFGKPVPVPNPVSFLAFIATAPPNLFLPDWWLEGASTWSETEYTKAGRGRSSYYEMILRMAVAEDNIPSIDRINGEAPDWPNGHMPYIFGLELQKFIADKYGRDSIEKLSLSHSGRFPYFLNGAPEGLLGKGYPALYNEMVEKLKEEENGRIRTIKEAPLTQFKTHGIKGEMLTNPRYSPDGRLLALNLRDPHGHERIIITDASGVTVDSIRRLPSDHAVAWSPDSSMIYFCQEEVNEGFYVYQDLYSYNLRNRRLQRLTQGLRLREPDISPDGRRFAAIVNKRGDQNLVIVNTRPDGGIDENLETLTEYRLMRVSGPRWSPDGSFIVYTVTGNSGTSSLYLYNAMEKTDKRLIEGRFTIAYPAWSKDGGYIIYTSDETGVYNLYAYSVKENRRYRITNMLGGAFQPDVSAESKEIVFSSYGSRGFKIASIPYNREEWTEKQGPAIKPYWKEDEREGLEGGYAASDSGGANTDIRISEPRPFSSLDTLAPRFWLPIAYSDHDGVVLGAYTAGQDVLQYHSYQLDVDYGAASSKWYYNAAYVYDYLYPTITLEAHRKPVLYSKLLQTGNYYELDRSYTLKVAVPINALESSYSFILGYTWLRQSALSGLSDGRFNNIDIFQGRRSYAFGAIEFSDALKYPYSISHEEGRSLSLLYKYYGSATGSEVNSREYIADYSQYLAPFKEKHSTVFLNLKGGASSGRRISVQAFQLGGGNLESDFPLRGYPSRSASGKYITTATIELRAPVKYIFEGWQTKPLFFEKLHGAAFADFGEVWGDPRGFSIEHLKADAGFEARLDLTLGYKFKVTPAIGIARGFNQDGTTRVYFTVYSNL